MVEEDAAVFSKWDQFVIHHICISFLIQGKLGELYFLSFQLIHSQEHRVGYCVSETKIGRASVKSLSSLTELYLRAGKPCEIPHATTAWKIQEGHTMFVGYRSICISAPVKLKLSAENVLRRVCRLHGGFSCPWKWKTWTCIASVARTDTMTGHRQEHFGQELQKTWDERWEAVMQTAVAQLITGNVNKTALD